MIISQGQFDLSAAHLAKETRLERESLDLFHQNGQGMVERSLHLESESLELSQQAESLVRHVNNQSQELAQTENLNAIPIIPRQADLLTSGAVIGMTGPLMGAGDVAGVQSSATHSGEPRLDIRTQLIKGIIETLTGRKINLYRASDFSQPSSQPSSIPSVDEASVPQADAPGSWGLRYQYHERVTEQEQTHFAATGQVITADGRQLDIELQLNMSRSFISENKRFLEAGAKLKDPLVINFDGRAAELTQTLFEFDIDADGTSDQIAFVRNNSGFLSLDKNSDGMINDGSELFGALTGNGFEELRAYDADGNGFIDEADAIYDRLRIWVKEPDGSDRLLALGERNVGAIYLGSIDTPFELKDSDNNLQGVVRSTGVFLHEDGKAGTLQQIDLVV
jgi:hypothetical protein